MPKNERVVAEQRGGGFNLSLFRCLRLIVLFLDIYSLKEFHIKYKISSG